MEVLVIAICAAAMDGSGYSPYSSRSEEHTSELQSRQYLVCRLLLEKKKAGKREDAEAIAHAAERIAPRHWRWCVMRQHDCCLAQHAGPANLPVPGAHAP